MNSDKLKLWTKENIIVILMNFLIALNFCLLMIIIADCTIKNFNSSPGSTGFTSGTQSIIVKLAPGHRNGDRSVNCGFIIPFIG